MARPFKQGVDYFPLNVHMDNKVKFVEIKFGLEGFAVIVKILQHIYDNGYWVEWGEDDQLLFCNDIKINFERYEQIFNECMKREIFSRFMYEEHKILTSTGIQKRYKEMVRRRKDVTIVTEYLLVDNIIGVNDGNNQDNEGNKDTPSKHDDGKSTQRKEKGNRNKKDSKKEEKKQYADYVFLTETEYGKLTEKFGDEGRDSYFLRYAAWISGQPKRVQDNRSAYLTILNWDRDKPNTASSTSTVGRTGKAAYQTVVRAPLDMIDPDEERKLREYHDIFGYPDSEPF